MEHLPASDGALDDAGRRPFERLPEAGASDAEARVDGAEWNAERLRYRAARLALELEEYEHRAMLEIQLIQSLLHTHERLGSGRALEWPWPVERGGGQGLLVVDAATAMPEAPSVGDDPQCDLSEPCAWPRLPRQVAALSVRHDEDFLDDVVDLVFWDSAHAPDKSAHERSLLAK
jgi:hypothetical protein